jgi:hypothetical protein
MDVRLASISATPDTEATWSFTPSTTPDVVRKMKIDFSVAPAATKQFCLDGPFTNLREPTWGTFADTTAGACAPVTTATVTASCARFEPDTLKLASGNPNYYTELGLVLLARY